MHKNRFGVTVGVSDKYSPIPRTTLYLCCTHGQSEGSEIMIQGLSWEPKPFDQLLAVHGTDSASWRSIVRDGALKTNGRLDLHFSVFRPGMMIKEMEQLKQEGTFLFVDPHYLQEQGYTVTIDLNDVSKVGIKPGGMPIVHLLTTVKFDGSYADLTGYTVPRTPD